LKGAIMDYMAYSHMFMANEEANENNVPNLQFEWKQLLMPSGVVTPTEYHIPQRQFNWLNFLKSSAWLALAGMTIFLATLTQAQALATSYVSTNGGCLRVRQHPNLHSPVVDCLPNGTPIHPREIINGFARLSGNRFVSARWIGRTPNYRRRATHITNRGVGGAVNLRFGSRSSAVREIQRALGVQPTGYYGPVTARAVRHFQARNHLPVDGVVGTRTRRALFGNTYSSSQGRGVHLRLGSRGASVREVQRALGVQPTGYYGPVTARAVRHFQARNHLPVDGVVGTRTRRALFGR
jgi:hypothetical protein